jgi:Mce-associated membrane protein
VTDNSDESTALDEPTQVDEPAEPDGATESTESDGAAVSAGARKSRVGLAVWLILAVSVVAVVLAFLSWRDANDDPDRDRAALRDNALIEGTTAVETMTSMDGRDVEAGIKTWQGVSTGVLHDQLLSVGDDEEEMLAEQDKIATGRVVQAALTELSDRSATLIAAVEVTVRSVDGTEETAVKRNRFSADLVLVNGEWKIENLQQVAVNL